MILSSICAAIACSPTAAFAKKKLPDVTHDGLVRVEKSKADAVYLQPGVDLSTFNKIILLEPTISFRKGWQSDVNSSRRFERISNDDMVSMIAKGKSMFMEEFTKVLEKKGYPVVHAPDADVLYIKAAVINLDVKAPDPNNTRGTLFDTYSDGAGSATLVLELYDSITGKILARGVDSKSDDGDAFSWRVPRTQSTNIADARKAFRSWARMLAKGLDRVKEAKAE